MTLNFNDDETRNFQGPQELHVAKLLHHGVYLLERAIEEDGILLIHCNAGMCRSTAAAAIILNEILPPGSEIQAIQTILDIRSIADPNWLMLDIADGLTGSKLVAAKEFLEPVITERFNKRHSLR